MGGFFGRAGLGLAIAGILMAGTALAQGPGGGMGMGPGPGFGGHRPPIENAFGGHGIQGRWWNNPKLVERLKLTDEQRKAFDEILLQHRETLIDLRGNVEKAELGMEPLIGQDQPNEGKILAQIDKVAQARAELEKANARYLLALRSKLTPEQWKLVKDFRANRGQERGGWGHDGQGPDGQMPERQGPGGQFHRRMAPPPPLPPAQPAPQGAGPQGSIEPSAGPGGSEAAQTGTLQ
jgi:Spy/CpxP family protein refolding chaperone